MRKGMSNTERKAQLLAILQEMYQVAQSQADFTAKKIAEKAGVSEVLLYRHVGAEFKALRSQLPGSRRSADEAMQALRRENVLLRQKLRIAEANLKTTAVKELDEAILLIQELDEQNVQLRQENKLLRKRLNEGGQVIITSPFQDKVGREFKVIEGFKEQSGG